MALRTLTGTILRATNLPWADATLRFDLTVLFALTDGTYPEDHFDILTDSAGAFSVALPVPDDADAAASWCLILPNGRILDFTLAAGIGSVSLASIVTTTYPPGTPNSFQTLLEAWTTVRGVDGITVTVDDDGIITAIGGGGGSIYGITKRVLPSGTTLTIAADESLVVAGRYTVEGTLVIAGGFAVVGLTTP